MKISIRLLAIIAGVITFHGIKAQDLLSAEEAIRIGLENNYDIRLFDRERWIAENNLSAGNAGFLPKLSLAADQNYSRLNANQEYLSGQKKDVSGAASDALVASAQLNWTLFDGLLMFTRYEKLKVLQEQGELQYLLMVEQTISEILNNYFNLIFLEEQINIVKATIGVDNERLQLAVNALEVGAGSQLEVLQAHVDQNADSALLLGLYDRFTSNRIYLNQLLARNPETQFKVPASFEVDKTLLYDNLHEKMLSLNTSLQLCRQDENLARLTLREVKGRISPSLAFNVGYNYTLQNSESGFLLHNQTDGIIYGLKANMSLFDGFNVNREKNNARIRVESSQIRTQSVSHELSSELYRAFSSYQNKLQLLVMETQNVVAATENLSIATERFRLGDLSGIEFREAQRNFMSAQGRLLSSQLETKLLEIALLQLSGGLQFKN